MAIAVNYHGNLETQLKGGMFGAYIVVMVLALVVAARERLWPGVPQSLSAGVVLVTHIGSTRYSRCCWPSRPEPRSGS